jgi:uncharacterized damage-inducible protein DinB
VNEIRVLRAQVALIGEVVEAAVVDLTPDEGLRTPIPGVNDVNWILGHLVHVNAGVLELLGHPGEPSSADLTHYAAGSPPGEDGADAWDLGELRDAFRQQIHRLDGALADAPPERMGAPPPPGFEGELRDFLHFITFHQGYHVGQLGMLRRALGHDRAFG